MTVHRILGPALAVAVGYAALVTPSTAWAFCRTTTCAVTDPPPECVRDTNGCFSAGIPLQWEQQCVSIAVAGNGSPALGLDYTTADSITASAFSLWLTTICGNGFPSIAVKSHGALACDSVEYNPLGPNANAVLFRDSAWPHDSSAIALTTVAFNPRTGKILDADMEVNSTMPLTPLSLGFVIAHEAGHFLGLDHSPDPTALMYFRHTLEELEVAMLQPDDQAGLCAAYPADRTVPACDFEPPHGFAADCGGNVSAGCAVTAGPSLAPGAAATVAAATVGLILGATGWGWRARRRRRNAPRVRL